MKNFLAIMTLGLLASVPAYADDDDVTPIDDGGFYVGAAFDLNLWQQEDGAYRDWVRTNLDANADVRQTTHSLGSKSFIGYWSKDNPNVGLEFGFANLGKTQFRTTDAATGANVSDRQRALALYLDALAGEFVSDATRLYGKVGVYYAQNKEITDGPNDGIGLTPYSHTTNNVGFHAGLAADYFVTHQIALQASVEDFVDAGKGDIQDQNSPVIGKFNVVIFTLGFSSHF